MEHKTYQNFIELLSRRRSIGQFAPGSLPPVILEQLSRAFNLAPAVGDDHSATCTFLSAADEIRALSAFSVNAFEQLHNRIESAVIKAEIQKCGNDLKHLESAPALALISATRTPSFLKEILGEAASPFFGRETSAALGLANLLLAAESLALGTLILSAPLALAAEFENFLGMETSRQLVAVVALGWKVNK